jgi:UDP-3-O-[3-hydroxymyristoyl] glucosamine N-acyltransferase
MSNEHRLTAAAAATLVGGEVRGRADVSITHPDAADRAGEGAITFLRNVKFAEVWVKGSGSAALISAELLRSLGSLLDGAIQSRAIIIVPDADLAMIRVLEAFRPQRAVRPAGVHPSAIVSPGASISPCASVGPRCTIEEGAAVGDGVVMIADVYLGVGARIGDKSLLYPGVRVLDRCTIGRSCVLHAGVVIGADGFGYRPTPTGPAKVPHIGNVVIEDHVEIGANSCIDRAMFASTIVGAGTKIDNLVQIAHNCRIGRCCIICGQCGLSGSVTLGDGVILGGGVGVADNLSIGDRAQVGARSSVAHDIPAGGSWLGTPAQPATEAKRNFVALTHLAETLAEIKRTLRAGR